MEVIYTGLRRTPEQIVEAAIQEDVDAIGISVLSGAHQSLVSRITALMREKGLADVLLFVGGIIPDRDIPALEALGVKRVFQPGARTDAIVESIQAAVRARSGASPS